MRRTIAACALVVAFVGTGVGSAAGIEARSKPPRGYHTVTVKNAGFSIAVPNPWVTLDPTSKDFSNRLKKFRKANPDFLSSNEVDVAVKHSKLFAIDPAGDSFHSNVNVTHFPDVSRAPTEDEIRGSLTTFASDIETKPMSVAGSAGIEAAYQFQVNVPEGGAAPRLHGTAYAVLGRKGGLLVVFTALEDGRQDPTTQTMIHSLKLLR